MRHVEYYEPNWESGLNTPPWHSHDKDSSFRRVYFERTMKIGGTRSFLD